MNQLQMLKRALIAYVNSVKAIWSDMAHPLLIPSKLKRNVKDYRIYGADGGVGDLVAEGDNIGKYHLPVEVRGKNYFDLNKVPFSSSANGTTSPYNNGLKIMKTSSNNRGNKIPIDLPVGKTIYLTLDVVDSQIGGTAEYVTLDFLDESNTRIRTTRVTSTIARKSYSFTLSTEVSYIQFYFQSNNSHNAVGDYLTIDNIMLRCEGDDVWEPYIKPQSVDIYLDAPIGTDDVIQKSVDGLPSLPQFKGTTVYEVQTEVPPSGIEVQYYE